MERDILANACGHGLRTRTAVSTRHLHADSQANQAVLPTQAMCHHTGVSTSGYYNWCHRVPSQRSLDDQVMTERIRQIHTMSDYAHGRARVQVELGDMGLCVNNKRIERLMRMARLRGVRRRRSFVVSTQRDRSAKAVPDLVRRQFKACGINRLWVADMTHVPTWGLLLGGRGGCVQPQGGGLGVG